MIFLYTSTLILLGMVKSMVALRSRRLERAFVRAAATVKELAAQAEMKPGNASKVDACTSATRMIRLAKAVDTSDRIEAKFYVWQRWTDRLGNWTKSLGNWKGTKLPYTMGAVDGGMLLVIVDYFGVGQYVSATVLYQYLMSLMQ